MAGSQAAILFGVSLLLFIDGYVLGPILERLGITRIARVSVALFFVALGTYMGWIAYLFATGEFAVGGANFSWEVIAMRVGVLLGLVGLTVQAFRQMIRNRSADEIGETRDDMQQRGHRPTRDPRLFGLLRRSRSPSPRRPPPTTRPPP